MSKLVKLVKHAFEKHPIISNSLLYGGFFVGAEFSQQTFTRKISNIERGGYDHRKLSRYGFLGVAVYSPVYYYWYRWLDRKFVGTSLKLVAKKLVIDQFFFTPQLLVIFFVAMSIMERKKDMFEECKQKFLSTFQTSCMFWLPAQTVNFLFVPSTFRVAFVGTCSFAWVNILCYIKRQESPQPQPISNNN